MSKNLWWTKGQNLKDRINTTDFPFRLRLQYGSAWHCHWSTFKMLISCSSWISLHSSLFFKILPYRTSLVVQWLRICAPKAGGPDSIPGQGTRSHMSQRRVPRLQLKIPRSTTKTWLQPKNNCFKIKKETKISPYNIFILITEFLALPYVFHPRWVPYLSHSCLLYPPHQRGRQSSVKPSLKLSQSHSFFKLENVA